VIENVPHHPILKGLHLSSRLSDCPMLAY